MAAPGTLRKAGIARESLSTWYPSALIANGNARTLRRAITRVLTAAVLLSVYLLIVDWYVNTLGIDWLGP